MSTEELSADLDRLKIAPSLPQINFVDKNIPIVLNPFYNDANVQSAEHDNGQTPNGIHRQRINQNRRRCRIRRRSDSFATADTFEIVNPLRCCSHKSSQHKKGIGTTAKKMLLREPILRAFHDCVQIKPNKSNPWLPANTKDEHSSDAKLKSSGISSFRDLISECNLIMDHDRTGKSRLLNSWHSLESFTTIQNDSANGPYKSSAVVNPIPRPTTLTCSQQASSSRCEDNDVNIDELASYFDNLVHIPRKMSSMAEMMYI